MEAYCAAQGVPAERCGKVVVATRVERARRLARAAGSGAAQRPRHHVARSARPGARSSPTPTAWPRSSSPRPGSPTSARCARRCATTSCRSGVELRLGAAVDAHRRAPDGRARRHHRRAHRRAGAVVNCAGLHADRVARMAGAEPDVTIVPFRGEYLAVDPSRAHLVRHLIYPVPDPRFPVSRRAPLARHRRSRARRSERGARAGAGGLPVERVPVRRCSCACFAIGACGASPARYWRTGAGEMARSCSRRLMVRQIQRLVPDLRASDLQRVRIRVCAPRRSRATERWSTTSP